MNKQLKIALLPAAVAAAMLSNTAFAGTESCFEKWTEGTDWTASGASYALEKYNRASCTAEFGLTGTAQYASAATGLLSDSFTNGKPNNNPTVVIAREKAVKFDVDLDKASASVNKVAENVNLTYVPTSDIPGGSTLTMVISGGTFGKLNSDQIFLLGRKADNSGWDTLLTTDGNVDEQSSILFRAQGGTQIPSGTRLVMSSSNTSPKPVKFALDNTECSLTEKKVTLTVTAAKDTTGATILGGTGATATLAVIKPQFETITSTQSDKVDAANEANSRELFATKDAYSPSSFYIKNNLPATGVVGGINYFSVLESEVRLDITPAFTGAAGEGVKFYIADDAAGSNGTNALDLGNGDKLIVPNGTDTYTLSQAAAGTGIVSKLFTENDRAKFVIENVQTNGARTPMNFNYQSTFNSKIHFAGAAGRLDHCGEAITSHNIGVNGAVLKVPYMRTVGTDQWIKITNESNKTASVLLDVFNDKATSEEAVGVQLGDIAAKETKLFFGNALLEAAVAKGYGAGDESTHTMTFVVTAPESSVHGVSVQTVPGKGDRVQPVLRASTEVTGEVTNNASGGVATIKTEAKAWKW